MPLSDALIFDVVGSLITSSGEVGRYLRSTPAYNESFVNGSWRIFGMGANQPRFDFDGALLLEKASINLLDAPMDLSDPSWIKGSRINIDPDQVQSMDGTYRADLVTVGAFTGNTNANTMFTAFDELGSAETYTLSIYIKLLSGRFGPNDVLRVVGDLVVGKQINLNTFNDHTGNYLVADIEFTTAGTVPDDAANHEDIFEPIQAVQLQLYAENAVSFAWGGAQLEPGTIRTSLIAQNGDRPSRDRDWLTWPRNPVAGLDTFTLYMNLKEWRGDGLIIHSGDFQVIIEGGILKARANTVEVADTGALPKSAQIAVRVSRGLGLMMLYVNGRLKAQEAINGYTGDTDYLQLSAVEMRRLKAIYYFNRDLGDGSIEVGEMVGGELADLFAQDSLLVDRSDGHSRITLAPIELSPGERRQVRMPMEQKVRQEIEAISAGAGTAQTKQVRVYIDTAADGPYTIVIGDVEFTHSNNGGSVTDIKDALVTAINSQRHRYVTAGSVSTSAFDVFADRGGREFNLNIVSPNMRSQVIQQATHIADTVTVPAAIDFEEGRLHVFRGYEYLTDVFCTGVNSGANTLEIKPTFDDYQTLQIQAGDVLIQSEFRQFIGPNNYFAHHLEDHHEVQISRKMPWGWIYENVGLTTKTVTPTLKITL